MATMVARKYIFLWFPLIVASFQCGFEDEKIFETAFKSYLSNFNIVDPTNFDGYRTAVEKIIENEGWNGSEKICYLVNSLNEKLQPIEDCIDTIFAASALNLQPNNSAIIHYFSNIKQWEYACNEGKDRFSSNFDCIRSHPQPPYCLNEDHRNCFGMKQEFLCVLHYYRENCGNDAALVLCSMQTVSYYGQNCFSRFDCSKEINNFPILTAEKVVNSAAAAAGNSTIDSNNNIFGHLRYVVAFWFTCRFVLYWYDLN